MKALVLGAFHLFFKDSSVIEGLLEGIFVFSRKINKLLIYPKIKKTIYQGFYFCLFAH
jgi:hypothetical protein